MSIKKQYLKTKPVCRVTFEIPAEIGKDYASANLVGEFNDWDENAVVMNKLKKGSFKVTIPLEKGKEYQFRYLLDGKVWQNDPDADKEVPSPYGDTNSVVVV